MPKPLHKAEKVPAEEARIFIVDDNAFYFHKAMIELCGQGVKREHVENSKTLVDAKIQLVEMFSDEDRWLPHLIILDDDFSTTEANPDEPLAAHFLEFMKDPKPDDIKYTTVQLTQKMADINKKEMAAALREVAVIFHTSSVRDEATFQKWRKNFPTLKLVDYSKDKTPSYNSVIQEAAKVIEF